MIRIVVAVVALAGIPALCRYAKGRGFKSWVERVTGVSRPVRREPPRVIVSRPGDGDVAVPPDVRIIVKVYWPNGGPDRSTLNAGSIVLSRGANGATVPASVAVSTDGVFISLKPAEPLCAETSYTVRITDHVTDQVGTKFLPFTTTFTTGSLPDPSVRFEKVRLVTATDAGFTCVQMGPDAMLYAGADDGRIFRYAIRGDGTLEAPIVIKSLQASSGGPRLLTGFCFDPRSGPQAPVLWASHGYYGFTDAPDWSGTVSELSGPDLATVRDAVIHLPRSVRDHLTNQPSFGPDGALYIPQPSNTAYGAPDADWGDRPERLLSATILRLDVATAGSSTIDARTSDGGGSYDPDAPGAPLTVYADGLRLVYDLLWHTNGSLYAPVNGSSAGGNAPAGGGAPALSNIPLSEHDWFFRIVPSRYYGHPNPQRGHYVLNGGNPTGGRDPAEVPQYPVGTKPDPQWKRALYDFGDHVSPNGIVELRGNAFGGRLRHRILVCRYNVGSDILCLGLDSAGNVSTAQAGIPGFTGFLNPLDLTENPETGCIYVAEYGRRCITLLRPAVTSNGAGQ